MVCLMYPIALNLDHGRHLIIIYEIKLNWLKIIFCKSDCPVSEGLQVIEVQ